MRLDFRATKPDPRILIIQIAVVAILASSFRNLLALFCLFLVVQILLLIQSGWKGVFQNTAIYCVLLALVFGLQMINIPVISNLFPLFLMLMIRVFPIYIAGRILMERTPMNELLKALEKWHIPKLILIPLAVVYRYVPTILKEIGYIRESLKMRNINSTIWIKCRHPIQSIENFLVPLLYRSEKISEELAAASICKGLSTNRKRTCCTDVRLNWSDIFYLLAMAAVSIALIFVNHNVVLF